MRALSFCLLAAALGACGGNVVVDTETIDTSTSTGSTSTTTQPQVSCTSVCKKIAAVCSGQPAEECAAGCAQTDKLGAFCPDAYAEFLACADASPAAQCNSAGCSDEANAFTACVVELCAQQPSACTL